MAHPDFTVLGASWELALRADGYSPSTVTSYSDALKSLVRWLDAQGLAVSPAQLDRNHVRGWLAATMATRARATSRAHFSGVRHFCRFLVAENEASSDATAGIRIPAPSEPTTPVLDAGQVRRLLAACGGSGFTDRRDLAMILVALDAGLRLGELASLTLAAVDLHSRQLLVLGKGSRRGGPRHRAVPFGWKTARALDRYLRARRRHPHATAEALWLGKASGAISPDGIVAMLERRARVAGLGALHPHMLRHTWAHHFRQAGGAEGDLMVLGGWRSRAMVDRYGRSAAAERAAEAGRRYSLADRL